MSSNCSAIRTAIQEIRRGEELMTLLLSHLQLKAPAIEISQEILQSLTSALYILRSKEPEEMKLKAEAEYSPTLQGYKRRRSLAASDDQRERVQNRRIMDSRTLLTPAPHLDGYEWRKYGQKMIHNSKHPRNYYRCTYRGDHGCLATKQVQELESHNYDDSPILYQVVYNNQHTCNQTASECGILTSRIIISSSSVSEPNSFSIFDESKRSYSGLNNSNMESNQDQLINSHSSQNEGSSGEICSMQNENCSSLITNPTSMVMSKTEKFEEDNGINTTMVQNLDSYGIDFYDADSINGIVFIN